MPWVDLLRPRVGDMAKHDATALRQFDLNDFKNNITHLRDVNKASYFHDGTGADWTTTSVPLVAIDATKFQVSLTTKGGPILVIFHGSFRRPTDNYMFFTILRQGDPVDTSEPNWPMYAATWKPLTFIKPFLDLPAGTYTFTAMWQISGGTVAQELSALTKPFMIAMESL